ncbi:PadR family transcriptional regulator [Gloeothece verrucosa]|uniref:Transcriptional regulator, PadR-like family n=1 Tax=Gloeothece verrucosa (strain PCC 7822) TaxID=497965 RepID=E0UEY4_GLOV7|nr:PadR family transcriptional regulator [Gloeothece verrucosa]ADN13114.1 transcriptional regulator, PadR-like family [Gloeothece verrucosa PCC 7822]
MFRPFHRHFFTPALAGFGHPFFASENFEGRQFKGGGRRGRHNSRTRRGDIKFILLSLLCERPRHGYELIKDLEGRYGGFRRLSPGSVYPTLQLLEEGGYLTSQQVEGKRVYTITESGQDLLTQRTQQTEQGSPLDDYYNQMSNQPSELMELSKALTQLNEAVTLIGNSGNLEQINRVRERIIELKREIYRMLSEQ